MSDKVFSFVGSIVIPFNGIDCFYYINYGAIEGFPALIKAVAIHVKIYVSKQVSK